MPKGGARPGAGRKPKIEKFATQINKAEKRIADRLPLLIDKLFELAEGVLVEDMDWITMKRSVYQKPPDRQAAEYLINRVMGKPTERQEVDLTADVAVKGYTNVSPDDWDDTTEN